jgi:hypothetical protein
MTKALAWLAFATTLLAARAAEAGYVGCFTDDSVRALPADFGGGYTVESCVAVASSQGYAYAGVQWYGECFGGNTLGYAQVGDGDCNTPCDADPGEMCGGGWRNSIYTAAAGPSSIAGYVGCYTDDGNRALPADFGGGYTIEGCVAAAASQGYAYAGLQWYGQCFAGNALGYSQVGDGECNTPCDANPAEACGGGWRNSIYATGVSGGGGPPPDTILLPGQSMTDEGYTMQYQGDGNLVFLRDGEVIGSSGTAGTSPGRVALTSDEVLVVYDAGGNVVWTYTEDP